MEHQARLMEIDKAERAEYLSSLRTAYGAGLLAGDLALGAAHQRSCELLRHKLNARLQPEGAGLAGEPRRLLVSVTQRCPFACAHCWVFGSPTAGSFLDLAGLQAIHRHTALSQAPRWTVSGGEFFSLPHFGEVLKQFPVDCVFSNGFWGYPTGRCRRYVKRIAAALDGRNFPGPGALTFILSYDSYHAAASGRSLPLDRAIASIIAEFYETLPQVELRISHAQSSPQDGGYREVLSALQGEGFAVTQTGRLDHNGQIATLSYRYQKQAGPARELFVDTYPVTPICRALLQPHLFNASASAAPDPSASPPRARYQYTVGPDGGVGLYQVLYAPPVPYWAGDLVAEPWSVIAARIARDPIAVTLETAGIAPILAFLERYDPPLTRSLAPGLHMIQQFLYLVLLDPHRRLLLNAFLLCQLHQAGRLVCEDTHLRAQIQAVLEAPAAGRQSSLRQLYGWQPGGCR